MNIEEIQKEIDPLTLQADLPKHSINLSTSPIGDGTPYVTFEHDVCSFIHSERGYEFSRKVTGSLDELLYWIAAKVTTGALIAGIANGTYQWFDLSQPGNENKAYDYLGTRAAAVTGGLAPGRGIWQNVGIAAGGAMFTDGPNAAGVGGAAAGAWTGGMFGEYARGVVNSVIGKELPALSSMLLDQGDQKLLVVSSKIYQSHNRLIVIREGDNMFPCLKLLIYSCFLCCLFYFILTRMADFFVYFSEGNFSYPLRHVIRTSIFGGISGVAITLAAIAFDFIDKFNARKKPASDYD